MQKSTQQNSNTHICPKKKANSVKKRRQVAEDQAFIFIEQAHKRNQTKRTGNIQ